MTIYFSCNCEVENHKYHIPIATSLQTWCPLQAQTTIPHHKLIQPLNVPHTTNPTSQTLSTKPQQSHDKKTLTPLTPNYKHNTTNSHQTPHHRHQTTNTTPQTNTTNHTTNLLYLSSTLTSHHQPLREPQLFQHCNSNSTPLTQNSLLPNYPRWSSQRLISQPATPNTNIFALLFSPDHNTTICPTLLLNSNP